MTEWLPQERLYVCDTCRGTGKWKHGSGGHCPSCRGTGKTTGKTQRKGPYGSAPKQRVSRKGSYKRSCDRCGTKDVHSAQCPSCHHFLCPNCRAPGLQCGYCDAIRWSVERRQVKPNGPQDRLRQLREELDDAVYFKRPASEIAAIKRLVSSLEDSLAPVGPPAPAPEGPVARNERLEQEAFRRAGEIERLAAQAEAAGRPIALLEQDLAESIRMRDPAGEIQRQRERIAAARASHAAIVVELESARAAMEAMAAAARAELAAAPKAAPVARPAAAQRRTYDGRLLDEAGAREIDKLTVMVERGSLTRKTLVELFQNAQRQYTQAVRERAEPETLHEISFKLMVLDHMLHVAKKNPRTRMNSRGDERRRDLERRQNPPRGDARRRRDAREEGWQGIVRRAVDAIRSGDREGYRAATDEAVAYIAATPCDVRHEACYSVHSLQDAWPTGSYIDLDAPPDAWNPPRGDARRREIERRAAQGDPEAQSALAMEQLRAGVVTPASHQLALAETPIRCPGCNQVITYDEHWDTTSCQSGAGICTEAAVAHAPEHRKASEWEWDPQAGPDPGPPSRATQRAIVEAHAAVEARGQRERGARPVCGAQRRICRTHRLGDRPGHRDCDEWVDEGCEEPVAGRDPWSGTSLCAYHLEPLQRSWAAQGRRDLFLQRARPGSLMRPPRLRPPRLNPDLPEQRRDSFLPAVPPQVIPRNAWAPPRVTWDLLVSGRQPLVYLPEGVREHAPARAAMERLVTRQGLASPDAWEDLLAAVGTRARVFVVDRHGERWEVRGVEFDYGGETGSLVLRHLGPRSRGGDTLVDIHAAYGHMLPVVVYKPYP